jgi:hypothetical protein
MHTQKITRNKPALIVILLDVSHSMNAMWGQSQKTLADGATKALNRTIRDLMINACFPQGEIMNYINLAVYAYGTGDDNEQVEWRLGTLAEPKSGYAAAEDWAPSHHRIETMDLGLLADNSQIAKSQKLPIWVEQEAIGWTPMCAALNKAAKVVKNHISNYSDSFPPIVINITDGQPTDHNDDYTVLQKAANSIKNQETTDGKTLLFNIHLDSDGEENIVLFPATPPAHTIYAEELAKSSSILPAEMARMGRKVLKEHIPESALGYCLNADFNSLVAFLRIGTTVVVGSEESEITGA